MICFCVLWDHRAQLSTVAEWLGCRCPEQLVPGSTPWLDLSLNVTPAFLCLLQTETNFRTCRLCHTVLPTVFRHCTLDSGFDSMWRSGHLVFLLSIWRQADAAFVTVRNYSSNWESQFLCGDLTEGRKMESTGRRRRRVTKPWSFNTHTLITCLLINTTVVENHKDTGLYLASDFNNKHWITCAHRWGFYSRLREFNIIFHDAWWNLRRGDTSSLSVRAIVKYHNRLIPWWGGGSGRPRDSSRIFRPITAAIWPSRLILRTRPRPKTKAGCCSTDHQTSSEDPVKTPVTELSCVQGPHGLYLKEEPTENQTLVKVLETESISELKHLVYYRHYRLIHSSSPV